MALDVFSHASQASMPAPLAAAPALARAAWISFRAFGAILTVPIAEELAFRGFLIRRVMRPDFESLDSRQFSWLAVVISSAAFGILHGARWPAGIAAGLIYAAAYLRRGRIGDAAAAHATTNLLIALTVLIVGQWNLW
jgi:CAAX prenyl protease-like protein